MTHGASIDYRVPYADTDQMGVVYYANFFVYFERVRNEMLRAVGYTYKQMEAEGLRLPVLEAHCDYRQPARYDDLLTIEGVFEVVSPARLRVNCVVRCGDQVLATGHTVHACVSAERNKPVRLPPALRGDGVGSGAN
jgi:acyl-CoA thioester hydrolase